MNKMSFDEIAKGMMAPPNMAIGFANLACYVGMTAIFFEVIGSKQYDMTVRDKVDYLRLYIEHASQETRDALCESRAKMILDIEEAAKEQEVARKAANRRLLRNRVGPIIIICLGVAIASFLRSAKPNSGGDPSKEWTTAHTTLLALVLLCFSTELFVFGGVLLPYEKIGDWEIVHRVAHQGVQDEESEG